MKQLKNGGGAPTGAPAKQEPPKDKTRILELAKQAQVQAQKQGDYYCVQCGLSQKNCSIGPYEWRDD